MTREEAIEFGNMWLHINEDCKDSNTYAFFQVAIKALETLEEFEKAQIITGGRLNGRTYAYKCGLEDGKRKALEQEPKSEWEQDHAILKAYSDGANEILDKIRAEIKVMSGDIETIADVLKMIDKCKAESEE